MLQEFRFALYAIRKNIESSAELRTSFLMNIVGMSINNIAFVLLWVFFVQSVGVINGWTIADIIGLQGFTAISYGLVFAFANGVRYLPDYVSSGSFDRYLLSPKNILLRVATSSFSPSAVGDILFGIICLGIFAYLIGVTGVQLAILTTLILLTALIFFAVITVIYSMSFFFVDAHTVTNSFIEMFLTPALFHGGAFQGVLRFVYTFIMPSLVIGTIPTEAVHHASLSTVLLVAVLASAWLVFAIIFFKKSIRRYESANFMTFGR